MGTIADEAFTYTNNLLNITVPASYATISSSAFNYSYNKTITINKAQDSISGSPWGASQITVVWTG